MRWASACCTASSASASSAVVTKWSSLSTAQSCQTASDAGTERRAPRTSRNPAMVLRRITERRGGPSLAGMRKDDDVSRQVQAEPVPRRQVRRVLRTHLEQLAVLQADSHHLVVAVVLAVRYLHGLAAFVGQRQVLRPHHDIDLPLEGHLDGEAAQVALQQAGMQRALQEVRVAQELGDGA